MILNPYVFAVSGGGDPDWASVTSLLHFDGTDGSTTFTDQTGKSWTPEGTAQIDTAQSKFGGASGLFDGFSRLSTVTDAGFGFGTGDFTVEGWLRHNPIGSGGEVFCDFRAAAGSTGLIINATDFSGSGTGISIVANGSLIVDVNGVHPTNTWFHYAVARASGTLKAFIDGVQAASVASAQNLGSTMPVWMARDRVNTGGYRGHIDDFRVTKGVARYTSGFTPPSAPFPNGP